jgi:DNA-binding NtrC family response regulator
VARILVVDDVSDLRDFLSEALFDAGFDVTTVGSVTEAKELLRRDELGCAVLLDLRLPDLPGQELLEWIRSHPFHRAAPVVIMTGDARVKSVPGSTGLLTKPLDIDKLKKLLAEHCARSVS